MSQRVLLALTQAGVSREDAYSMVQRNALKVWEFRTDFREELLGDEAVVKALGVDAINENFGQTKARFVTKPSGSLKPAMMAPN